MLRSPYARLVARILDGRYFMANANFRHFSQDHSAAIYDFGENHPTGGERRDLDENSRKLPIFQACTTINSGIDADNSIKDSLPGINAQYEGEFLRTYGSVSQ